MSATLNPKDHPWMTGEDVSRLFAALPSGSLRFVGGCVRNALLGEAVRDIDLACQLDPKDVQSALKAADIKTVPTGIEHGTVTAIVNKKPFEITSLRKDVETDGRRAVVSFTQDWAEDAQRRDFTINALYADRDGTVFDPTERGLSDIEKRTLHFVGDADARVQEDYLRILRFFRFLAWYGGKSKVEAAALKACRENRQGLKKISAERIWTEFKRLLEAPDPSRALRIMLTNDILDMLLPEASNVEGLEKLIALETREDLAPDPLLRLMAMSARDEFALAGLCKRLKSSKAERSRILGWAGDRTSFDPNGDARDKKIALYNAGQSIALDRILLRAAGEEDPVIASRWVGLHDFAKDWDIPEFPLKGRDLKTAGLKDGPEMGKKLTALRALWVRSGFTADKARLLQALALINR